MSQVKTVTVRLVHSCSISNSRWCEPVGWEPANKIKGAELYDGSWWDDDEEIAGLAWFGNPDEYGPEEVIEVSLDDLRVVSTGNCRVIDRVTVQ